MGWTQKVVDHFTDTSLLDLISHTPDLGSGWSNPAGAGVRPTIDTAGTGLRNGGDNIGYNNTTIGNDQGAQWTFKNVAGQAGNRLFVRHTNVSTGELNRTGYSIRFNSDGVGTNLLGLERVDNGSRTALASPVSVTWANDDIWRIEVIGTALEGFVNAVSKITGSDGTYASGGVALFHSTGADPCADDFIAEEFVAGIGIGALTITGKGVSMNYTINMPDEL